MESPNPTSFFINNVRTLAQSLANVNNDRERLAMENSRMQCQVLTHFYKENYDVISKQVGFWQKSKVVTENKNLFFTVSVCLVHYNYRIFCKIAHFAFNLPRVKRVISTLHLQSHTFSEMI